MTSSSFYRKIIRKQNNLQQGGQVENPERANTHKSLKMRIFKTPAKPFIGNTTK